MHNFSAESFWAPKFSIVISIKIFLFIWSWFNDWLWCPCTLSNYFCNTNFIFIIGRIDLREDTVETLLGTACLLRLVQVVDAACVFLKRQLHPSNCIGIYLFADSQGCVELRDAAFSYTTVCWLIINIYINALINELI